MTKSYIEPTQEAASALFSRQIDGEVVMLNLLRFRDMADYSDHPDLAPKSPISGREAYQKYMDHTFPFLKDSGGEVIFLGEGGSFLIGPQAEKWDLVMLVKQHSLTNFMEFASNPGYLAGMGHRSAALQDSRLLPMIDYKDSKIIT